MRQRAEVVCVEEAGCKCTAKPMASYTTPVGVWSIVINPSVCLSIHKHISGTAGSIFTKFFVHIPSGRGSVLLWGRCAKLCTSSFADDVMFGRNGREASKGWQHSASAINYVHDRGGV